MWSPRRVVILGVSFVLIFLCYLSYGFSAVGGIDGLPPLPPAYHPDLATPQADTGTRPPSEVDKRIKFAFGEKCDEVRRPIRLDVRSRGMLLAAEKLQLRDGHLILNPISVAMLGKGGDKVPDLTTIRAQVAHVWFDQPVENFSDLAKRKIAKAELSGKIEIINNRRRAERDQDLRINIPVGPLYYDEEAHRIWTNDQVHVLDNKGQPRPHRVQGKGLEMLLAVEPPPPGAARNPRARDTVTGVKWLELKSAVAMQIYTEGKSNFFDTKASPVAGKPAEEKAAPGQYARLNVTTPGKFRFEINKGHDLATFESPPRGAHGALPTHVHVHREAFVPPKKVAVSNDHLICRHLQLRLKRREKGEKGAPPPPKDDAGPEGGITVETIHATDTRDEVVLTSEAEGLDARGCDFFHDAQKGVTVLKGKAGTSVKRRDSKVFAMQLILRKRPAPAPAKGQPPPRDSFDVDAAGPGWLEFHDPKDGRRMKSRWARLLTVVRDGEEDLITLEGDAEFHDIQGDQQLKADILKVWLDPEAPVKSQPAAQPKDDAGPAGRKPRHLEATGNVVLRSRDLNIHDTTRLVVKFQDLPPEKQLPAAPGAPASPGAPKPATTVAGPVVPAPGPSLFGAPPAREGAPPRPFDLSARSVEAKVLRSPARSTVDTLTCEGKVEVRQKADKPGDKDTEISGDTLNMTAGKEETYVLVVGGDLARLQKDRIMILGPEVHIDQYTNKAWVIGQGAMQMESETSFQGDKLERPVPMNVIWNQRMVFHGQSADFEGGVQGTQGEARLQCRTMQVHLTRAVSLRPTKKKADDAPPRVRYLWCDKNVRVEEKTKKDGQTIKSQRLKAIGMVVTALEREAAAPGGKARQANKMHASGPGSFQVVDVGSSGPLSLDLPTGAAKAPPAAPAPKPAQGLRMTYVQFKGTMLANSKTGVASFFDDVRVLHIPVKSHDDAREVDLDKVLLVDLPENAMYLRCKHLKVLDRLVDGKPNKNLEANRDVSVQGRDFTATADQVTYDQSKELVVFSGGDSSPAILKKFDAPGVRGQTITAKRIFYWRKTKVIKTERTFGVSGTTAP